VDGLRVVADRAVDFEAALFENLTGAVEELGPQRRIFGRAQPLAVQVDELVPVADQVVLLLQGFEGLGVRRIFGECPDVMV
jgi:hypothetical protein